MKMSNSKLKNLVRLCKMKVGLDDGYQSDPKWNSRYLELAGVIASWSKDTGRKVGAIIVDDRKVILAQGYNGFPRGVNDTIEARYEKPAKYQYTAHAEANAICNAAATGTALKGATMYVTLFPCAACSRLIIQSGICRVVTTEAELQRMPRQYADEIQSSMVMMKEAGVVIELI